MTYVLARSERFTLYHGDALDALATIPTESVDLVITAPPYGVEWQSGRRAATFDQLLGDGADDRDGIAQILAEAVRAVGQNRHLYVFGPADVLETQKVSEVVELIWDKGRNGMGDLSATWAPAHERISFAVSKHRHGGKTGTGALAARLRRGSVLRYLPPTGRTVRHPSEKPTDLLAELIESSSRQGETVLDPFGGVGSTGVAALLAGRRAIVVEINEAYAQIAAQRLAAAERIWEAGRAT